PACPGSFCTGAWDQCVVVVTVFVDERAATSDDCENRPDPRPGGESLPAMSREKDCRKHMISLSGRRDSAVDCRGPGQRPPKGATSVCAVAAFPHKDQTAPSRRSPPTVGSKVIRAAS